MRIFVTDQHITDGHVSQASNPVALALREQLDRVCSCVPHSLWIAGLKNEGRIHAPLVVQRWLDRFWGGELPEPFEFDLPDDLLATARPGTTLTESRHRI